jgi:hypothetical protein
MFVNDRGLRTRIPIIGEQQREEPTRVEMPQFEESQQSRKRRLFKAAFKVISKEYSWEPRKARRKIAWAMARKG